MAVTDPSDPNYDPSYQPMAVPPPASSSGGLLNQTVGTVQQPLPPVDPSTFQIDPNTYENDSVVKTLNDLTSHDSNYMQAARQVGLNAANKRGLLNSSIAAGSSEASALQYAAPIAEAQANIVGARNLARVNAYFTGQQQDKDIAAREHMLGEQLSNEQLLQANDLANKLKMQGIDITNQQQMQKWQIDATKQIAQMNIDAESARLNRQLTAQEKMQQTDLAAQQARLASQIASQEKQTTQQLKSQETIANLNAATQTQINALNNTSENQRAALNYYLGQQQIYASGVTALYNNADMPAPARDAAIQQLTALKNSAVDVPAAVLGVQMNWPSGTPPVVPPSLPVPTTPTTSTAFQDPTTLPTAAELAAMKNDGTPGNYAYYSSLASKASKQ